jgi:TonB family protein
MAVAATLAQAGGAATAEIPGPLAEQIEAARAALVAAGKPVVGENGVSMPAKTRDVAPLYPRPAKALRMDAFVALKGILDRRGGRPRDLSVLDCTHPGIGLEEAALRAARDWRFEAPLKDGAAIDAWASLIVPFIQAAPRYGPDEFKARLAGFIAEERDRGAGPAGAVDSRADCTHWTDPKDEALQAPQKVNDIKPRYPRAAMQNGVYGQVALSGSIDQAGQVVDLKVVLSTTPGWGFEAAALEAVPRWQFKPARDPRDGRPTCVHHVFAVTFLPW